MKTVAVIQPYFFPYAGYYRLFAAADQVVMFDCVQFPRRGWVHRNKFLTAAGEEDWLTLPLKKADRDIRIDELEFANDAAERLDAALRRFPLLDAGRDNPLVKQLLTPGESVTAYLCNLVERVASLLKMSKPTIRSSSLEISPELHAQQRVIAIVQALGGTRYVNPSGGRALYNRPDFASAGIDLQFLTPYQGSTASILTRLLSEPHETVASEVLAETVSVP